jgi:hypothetical protein
MKNTAKLYQSLYCSKHCNPMQWNSGNWKTGCSQRSSDLDKIGTGTELPEWGITAL